MARTKVVLEYIPNKSTRCATFQKRSRSLMKKAGEVSTMCNTKACIIVYGEGHSVPKVFPSRDEAVAILNRFRSITKYEKLNNKMGQEMFLHKRICKLRDQAIKIGRDYDEHEIRFLVHKAMLEGHMGLSIQELTNVRCKVEVLRSAISNRITKICGKPLVYQPSKAQVMKPYVTDSMQAQAPPHQQEEWLKLMRSKGGYHGSPV